MNPAQSLYDFTLTLLNDPSARSAFGQDPQQTLNDAGLGDLSGADLHDILPLVLDYAPVTSLGGVDVDSITTGQAGAIEQFNALTQNLALGDTTTGTNLLGSVGGMTALTQNITDPLVFPRSPLQDAEGLLGADAVDGREGALGLFDVGAGLDEFRDGFVENLLALLVQAGVEVAPTVAQVSS